MRLSEKRGADVDADRATAVVVSARVDRFGEILPIAYPFAAARAASWQGFSGMASRLAAAEFAAFIAAEQKR